MTRETLLAHEVSPKREGAAAFFKSWDDLLACLLEKSATLRRAG